MKLKNEEKIPVVVVAGPTASGKTELSVRIALQGNGEIVSADSMQIYRGMTIGTAKPSVQEMMGVPHHMMDFLSPGEDFSVAMYCAVAKNIIKDIHGRGKIPVLVGGTGLYIQSLIDNIAFTPSPSDPALRAQLYQQSKDHGGQSLLDQLMTFDPAMAESLHPNNVGRIIRAIEIYRLTGVTMTQQLLESKKNPSPYSPVLIGLDCRDRQKLYDRINRRVDFMIEQGLVEEVRALIQKATGKTAVQAIGYKELIPYLEGRIGLEEATDRIKQETRRYAKRQLTWFRRDRRFHWLFVDDYDSKEALCCAAFEILRAWRI